MKATGLVRRLKWVLLLAAIAGPGPGLAAGPAKYSVFDIHRQVGSSEGTVEAFEPKTALTFQTPKAWSAQSDSDANVLLKLSGTDAGGRFGEAKLMHFKDQTNQDVAKNAFEGVMATVSPNSKKVGERMIRFGARYQYVGPEISYDIAAGETPFRNRLVFFMDQDRVCCFSLLSKASEAQAMTATFDNLLGSVSRRGGGATVRSSQAGQTRQAVVPMRSLALASYTDKAGRISVGHPVEWKFANNDPGKDFDVKFQGKNARGQDGELHISCTERPADMTAEQFMNLYEQTYLKPLRDYRQTTRRTAQFGVSHSEGIFNYSAFSAEGIPARQACVVFVEGKYCYAIALNTVGWSENEARDLFERILTSVKMAD